MKMTMRHKIVLSLSLLISTSNTTTLLIYLFDRYLLQYRVTKENENEKEKEKEKKSRIDFYCWRPFFLFFLGFYENTKL
jgi:hypothetical protein